MTATAPPVKPTTNGSRRPVRIEVDQHEWVGQVMDWQSFVREAMYANAAGLQILMRMEPKDAVVYEAMRAHHDVHNNLAQLLLHLQASAGLLDRPAI